MKILITNEMVDINSESISYSNIRNLYVAGNGYSLQLTEDLESKRFEITNMCNQISEKIYELQKQLTVGF